MRYSLPPSPLPSNAFISRAKCGCSRQRYLGSGPQREGNVCARSGLLKNSKGAVLLFLVFTSVFFWGRDCDLCMHYLSMERGKGESPPQAPISFLVTYELFKTLMHCDNPPSPPSPQPHGDVWIYGIQPDGKFMMVAGGLCGVS